MKNFDTLRAALAAGPTAGPWNACEWSLTDDSGALEACGVSVAVGQNETTIQTTAMEGDSEADVRYIAEANPATIAALLAALDAATKDAERYRYLRNRAPADVLQNIGEYAGCWIDCEVGETLTLLTGDDADAAIDAAMKDHP